MRILCLSKINENALASWTSVTHRIYRSELSLTIIHKKWHSSSFFSKNGIIAIRLRARERNIGIVNVYIGPNLKRDDFRARVSDVSVCLDRLRTKELILGGDVNSFHHSWDHDSGNVSLHHNKVSRGKLIYELLTRWDLTSVVDPVMENWTFRRGDYRSAIDICFISESVRRSLVTAGI